MRFSTTIAALGASFFGFGSAQQYMGDVINTTLPGVPGAEIAFWKIQDGKKNNLTLINYINHGSDGKRLVPSKIKRALIFIHGLDRDPGTYEANALSALAQVQSSDINTDSVAVVAPYFPNGDDKGTGYPWVNGLKPNQGSITNVLVWKGSQWSAGSTNQYPYTNTNTSSYNVLDQMVQYFDNATMFPNLNQIVVAGHSLGAQTVQRYASIGQQLNTRSPVTYWVGNPNSYVWLSTDRPLSTASCSIYDVYREGYTNFSSYPMTYGLNLVNSGRANILANYNSKAIAYARGTQDAGDDSSSCAPFTTGANRNERFFNFIKAFPISCPDPAGPNCDTVDLVNCGHDGGCMMASAAGQARLFIDNFYGNRSRSYDFGYPRVQAGDDPFPNPALNGSVASVNNNTYAGGMTYQGCWSDQTAKTLTNLTYAGNANTIESCTAACFQGGNTVAGLEFGTQCHCGTSLGYQATEVIEGSCNVPCSGNANETCGGNNRLSIFATTEPTINAPPGTPEVVGSSFYYQSCYTEVSGRTLSAAGTSGSFMTLEYCANFCSAYQYFGTEYGQECYCGNSIASGATIASPSDCNMLCANSTAEFCGAGNRLTLYQNTTWVAPTGTTTSAGPSATSGGAGSSSTGVSCPASNATTVTSNGLNFTIECGVDHQGGDLTSLSVNSFQQCIDTCAQNPQCVDVSLSGSACYLKSTLGPAVSSGVWGAKLITSGSSSSSSSSASSTTATSSQSTVSGSSTASGSGSMTSSSSAVSPSASASSVADCPGSNNTLVVSNGQTFVIECGVDHAGGDLASLSSNFQGCIDACANNPSCVDVSLSGSACYLKSSVGAPVNNGVWGARLIASNSSSSSSSLPASASVTITSSTTSVSSSVSSTSATSSNSSSTSASTTLTTSSVSSTLSTSTTTSSASASASPVICPGSDGTTYVSNGVSFLIECGIDHAGGDMSSKSVNSFGDCITACATTPGCVDVSLSGSACYLKSTLGAAVKNGVWGAKVVASGSSSTSSVSTTSSSTSSASSVLSSTSSVNVTSSITSTSSSSTGTASTSTTTSGTSSSTAVSSTGASSTDVASSTSSASSSTLSTSTSSVVTSTSSATSSSTTSSSTSPTTSSTSSAPSSSSPSSTTLSTVTVSSTSTSTSASTTPTKLACPSSNSTLYTAPQGNQFIIECGIDHAGGDMSMVHVTSFIQCVNACDSTAGCVDVSLSGSACYLKSKLGAALQNGGILGAKLVASASATSSSATATATF